MTTTTYRQGCGTHMGLLLHHAAGEPACGECLEGDMLRRLVAEEVPRRPTHPALLPISDRQAEHNREVLLAAVYGPPDLIEDASMPGFLDGPAVGRLLSDPPPPDPVPPDSQPDHRTEKEIPHG